MVLWKVRDFNTGIRNNAGTIGYREAGGRAKSSQFMRNCEISVEI